ncbi:hypothetical protein KVT40_007585 [Elsinoe batatas]|uniref:Uncharacterized protein n=1 Tax=Elsinoe batatas TaxID=2601811 RepID=A0A8K0L2B9_9PEZI|nr:hypothetical protein KVT40_007585 [Elsinoe batatas]
MDLVMTYDHVVAERYTHELSLHPDAAKEHSKQTWILTRPRRELPNILNLAVTCRTTYQEALPFVYHALRLKVDLPFWAEMSSLPIRLSLGIQLNLITALDFFLPIESDAYKSLTMLMELFEWGSKLVVGSSMYIHPNSQQGFYSDKIKAANTVAERRRLETERDKIILKCVEQHLSPTWRKTPMYGYTEWINLGPLSSFYDREFARLMST